MERWPRHHVRGQAVDAAEDRRPGVPKEHPPIPDPGVHWSAPPVQARGRDVLERSGVLRTTATFGTAAPPRWLSGLVRRFAHRIPEHRPSRWILLLGADRLDLLEHRAAHGWVLVPTLAVGAVAFVAAFRLARRLA
jgi:hypothetical protein